MAIAQKRVSFGKRNTTYQEKTSVKIERNNSLEKTPQRIEVNNANATPFKLKKGSVKFNQEFQQRSRRNLVLHSQQFSEKGSLQKLSQTPDSFLVKDSVYFPKRGCLDLESKEEALNAQQSALKGQLQDLEYQKYLLQLDKSKHEKEVEQARPSDINCSCLYGKRRIERIKHLLNQAKHQHHEERRNEKKTFLELNTEEECDRRATFEDTYLTQEITPERQRYESSHIEKFVSPQIKIDHLPYQRHSQKFNSFATDSAYQYYLQCSQYESRDQQPKPNQKEVTFKQSDQPPRILSIKSKEPVNIQLESPSLYSERVQSSIFGIKYSDQVYNQNSQPVPSPSFAGPATNMPQFSTKQKKKQQVSSRIQELSSPKRPCNHQHHINHCHHDHKEWQSQEENYKQLSSENQAIKPQKIPEKKKKAPRKKIENKNLKVNTFMNEYKKQKLLRQERKEPSQDEINQKVRMETKAQLQKEQRHWSNKFSKRIETYASTSPSGAYRGQTKGFN